MAKKTKPNGDTGCPHCGNPITPGVNVVPVLTTISLHTSVGDPGSRYLIEIPLRVGDLIRRDGEELTRLEQAVVRALVGSLTAEIERELLEEAATSTLPERNDEPKKSGA